MKSESSLKQEEWAIFLSQNKNQSFKIVLNKFRELVEELDLPIVWTPENYPIVSNTRKWMRTLDFESYPDFYQWSIDNKELFWEKAVDSIPVKFHIPYSSILESAEKPDDITWLPGAAFNIVESCFLADPNQIAIYFQSENDTSIRTCTFQQLVTDVRSYAAGFVAEGVAPKDRIILYLPFSIEAITTYLALIYMGAEPVLVADSFSSSELKKRIDIIHAKAVITTDSYVYADKTIQVLAKVLEANPVKIILHTQEQKNALSIRNNTSDILLSSLAISPSPDFSPYYHSSTDVISILFSSGTTKEPKALPWLATTPIKCAADGLLLQDIHEGDIVTWTSGMGWMMAPWLIFASLLNKASIAVFNGAYSKKEFLDFTVNTKVTVLGTIPSVVKSWRAQHVEQIKNWYVRIFSSTGEPSDTEDYLFLMYLNQFKAPIIEYCGGTEIGGAYISSTVELPNALSYFNTPAPGSAFILVNSTNEIIKTEDTGEVFLVPPAIGLSQHILNKNHAEEYYSNLPYFPDYPLLRKHGDGYTTKLYNNILYYKSVGRTDDAMNLGGIKISAVEIESTINKHNAVVECAAVAYQEQNGGPEKLAVFVQPKNAQDVHLLQKELQKIIQTELNPLFKISMLLFKDTFPRTASNKLMRKELRKELMEYIKTKTS